MTVYVDFRCENCHLKQTEVMVEEDANVTCPHCEHTVNVGVYLGPAEYAELIEERDPPLPPTEEVPVSRFAIVRETFQYEVPVLNEDEVDEADGRIADFGPDADDVRERAREFGCEMTEHRIEVIGQTGDPS